MTKPTSKKLSLAFVSLSIFIVLLLSLSLSSAITAKVGNSRMVLRYEAGDIQEKHIRVINDNNETITIEFIAQGNLSDSVVFAEPSFNLSAQEEKKAPFTITSDKPGAFTTKILVKFVPSEGEGNGIILPSTVVSVVSEPQTSGKSYLIPAIIIAILIATLIYSKKKKRGARRAHAF